MYCLKISLIENKLFDNIFLFKLKNTVKVLCPCGENHPQDVLLSFNEDTVFKCQKCNKDIRATTNVGTSLLTSPINTSSTSPTITKI